MNVQEEITRADLDDPSLTNTLLAYTQDRAPRYLSLAQAFHEGRAVKVDELQELIAYLHEEVIKHLDTDDGLDADTQRLEDVLAKLGGQL